MSKEKKITIKKKISTRDFINLLCYLETGEDVELDLSAYDISALAEMKERTAKVTPEQKEMIDKFFNKMPAGRSAKSFLDELKVLSGGANV